MSNQQNARQRFFLGVQLFFDGCIRCYCAVTALLARYLSAVYGLLLRCYPAIAGLNQPKTTVTTTNAWNDSTEMQQK